MLAMPECGECALLRREYAGIALRHEELRLQLRTAIRDNNREFASALILSEAAALREKNAAESAYRRHCAAAHGAAAAG